MIMAADRVPHESRLRSDALAVVRTDEGQAVVGRSVPTERRRPQNARRRWAALGEEVVRVLPLQPLDQATGRDLRRARHDKVDMVAGDVPFQDLHLLLPADLPDEFAHPEADLARQDGFAILGHPHEVQVDHEHGVGAVAVVHAAILPQALLKLSPEGEGFNPPKWAQSWRSVGSESTPHVQVVSRHLAHGDASRLRVQAHLRGAAVGANLRPIVPVT